MKITKISLFIIIVIVLLQIYIIFLLSYPREDVNRDGKVNALDLLIVQKAILEGDE